MQRAVEQIKDIPVPGRGGGGARGGLQGFLPRTGVSTACSDAVEQIMLTFLFQVVVLAEVFQISLPGHVSSASSSRRLHDHADEGIQEGFLTFPQSKKSPKVTRQSGAELLGEVSSSTQVPSSRRLLC